MVNYLYGQFEDMQFEDAIVYIRKKIFYLLLIVDEETSYQFGDVDVEKAYMDVFYILDGLNEILDEPKELVTAISLLQSALNEYMSPEFDFNTYRKLVLDSGNEINKITGRCSYAKP